MIKLTLENIVDVIINLFPEFKKFKDYEDSYLTEPDFKYLLIDIFGRFFKERIEKYNSGDYLVLAGYQFLNEQFNESESDEEALNYLGMEIFENLSTSNQCMKISREFLTGKALEFFNKTVKYCIDTKNIGDGGVIDILKNQLKTRGVVAKREYLQKIENSLRGLNNLLKDKTLSADDRSKVNWLIDSIKSILKGGVKK